MDDVTGVPCRRPHPTVRGVYCERTVGHSGEHVNTSDRALVSPMRRWSTRPPPPVGEPDQAAVAAAREGRVRVSLRCLQGQHADCGGHTVTGSLCGCPDDSHGFQTLARRKARDAQVERALRDQTPAGPEVAILPPSPTTLEPGGPNLDNSLWGVQTRETRPATNAGGIPVNVDPDMPPGVFEVRNLNGDVLGRFKVGEPIDIHPGTIASMTTGHPAQVDVEVALTSGEVKRIVGAHMQLRPEVALATTRDIIRERLINPGGAP